MRRHCHAIVPIRYFRETRDGVTSCFFLSTIIDIPPDRVDQSIDLVYSLGAFLRPLGMGDVPSLKLGNQLLHCMC